MAAGLIVPVSGPYVATWNSLPMGTTGDDGYELSGTFTGQEIAASDAYGLTLTESIWRGLNWRLTFRALEWNKTAVLALAQMFGGDASGATFAPTLANIGDRWSKYCQTLILTAILSNPPTTPQTLTALTAGIAPNSSSAFNMTSKMREMPYQMVLLPYAATVGSITTNKSFSTT